MTSATPWNNCCKQCELSPLERGFTSGVVYCKNKDCPCHTKPATKNLSWEREMVEAILAALEYRGFNDLGKYLDDTLLEHVVPIVNRLLTQHKNELIGKVRMLYKHETEQTKGLYRSFNEALDEIIRTLAEQP